MAGLKRKNDVDQVSDDFSDFSLSSPATKIRRLDAELPPIAEMEEEMEQEEPISQELEEEEEGGNPNEERALVLFNPLPHSPFSFTLHSNLISGIKNWSKQYDSDCDRLIRSQQQQEEEQERKNQRLALVPWVPSSSTTHVDDSNTEEEEADEMGEEASMDVEQQDHHTIIADTNFSASNLHHAVGGITAPATPSEGFHQWQQQQQQQHCLLPQFPQNTSTPITFTWTR